MKGTSNKWMHEELNKNNLCLNKKPYQKFPKNFTICMERRTNQCWALHGIFKPGIRTLNLFHQD